MKSSSLGRRWRSTSGAALLVELAGLLRCPASGDNRLAGTELGPSGNAAQGPWLAEAAVSQFDVPVRRPLMRRGSAGSVPGLIEVASLSAHQPPRSSGALPLETMPPRFLETSAERTHALQSATGGSVHRAVLAIIDKDGSVLTEEAKQLAGSNASNNVWCGSHAAFDCKGCPMDRGKAFCHGDCRWWREECVQRETMVSCGNYSASSCKLCTYNQQNLDMGYEWCHGDCSWVYPGMCVEIKKSVSEDDSEEPTVAGNSQGNEGIYKPVVMLKIVIENVYGHALNKDLDLVKEFVDVIRHAVATDTGVADTDVFLGFPEAETPSSVLLQATISPPPGDVDSLIEELSESQTLHSTVAAAVRALPGLDRCVGYGGLDAIGVGSVEFTKGIEPPDNRDNGQDMCQGHGYSQQECEGVGCCAFSLVSGFADGVCMSTVGSGSCGPPLSPPGVPVAAWQKRSAPLSQQVQTGAGQSVSSSNAGSSPVNGPANGYPQAGHVSGMPVYTPPYAQTAPRAPAGGDRYVNGYAQQAQPIGDTGYPEPGGGAHRAAAPSSYQSSWAVAGYVDGRPPGWQPHQQHVQKPPPSPAQPSPPPKWGFQPTSEGARGYAGHLAPMGQGTKKKSASDAKRLTPIAHPTKHKLRQPWQPYTGRKTKYDGGVPVVDTFVKKAKKNGQMNRTGHSGSDIIFSGSSVSANTTGHDLQDGSSSNSSSSSSSSSSSGPDDSLLFHAVLFAAVASLLAYVCWRCATSAPDSTAPGPASGQDSGIPPGKEGAEPAAPAAIGEPREGNGDEGVF